MNNAVFGKTMESLRKRIDVRLVNNEKRLKKLTAMPSFQMYEFFSEDLASFKMRKTKLVLNKPIYVGFSILDISKILMYKFHYEIILPRYGSKAVLFFAGTDSLCLCIEADYDKDRPLYSTTNKKVLAKMKDETTGIPPLEYAGLCSKIYSILCDRDSDQEVANKRAKGRKKCVVQQRLTHDTYMEVLFGQKAEMVSMNMLWSQKHQIYTVTVNKIGLSAFDDKRYLLNASKSLAYGHYKIVNGTV